jgi:LemA protein
MDSVDLGVLVFLVVLLLLIVWAVQTYNKLIRLQNRADQLWASVDVQLKRRHDLIPNLVNALEGYATHERGTLDEIVQARSQAIAASTPVDQTKAENVLTGALGRLFSDVEHYPNLKAEGDFQRLEQELAALEQTIAMSRDAYNITVQAYNNAVETVPSNFVASLAGFAEREYLAVADEDRATPAVDVGLPPVPGTAPVS